MASGRPLQLDMVPSACGVRPSAPSRHALFRLPGICQIGDCDRKGGILIAHLGSKSYLAFRE